MRKGGNMIEYSEENNVFVCTECGKLMLTGMDEQPPEVCEYCGADNEDEENTKTCETCFCIYSTDKKECPNCSDAMNLANYETGDIDFTGCHPVIAAALKKGLSIKCKVWDNECDVICIENVIAFRKGFAYEYICSFGNCFKHAEPIKKKVIYVKSLEFMQGWIKAKGCKFHDNGDCIRSCLNWDIHDTERCPTLIKSMLDYCGKEKPNRYTWHPDWLEEL